MKNKMRSICLLFMIGVLTACTTACTGEVSASNGASKEESGTEMSTEMSAEISTEISTEMSTENTDEKLDIVLPEEPELMGGWTASESVEITDEVREMVINATDGLLGVEYEPVAYLGSQVVAGSNHCVLCRASVVSPDSKPYYVYMYIYRDLDGNCSILKIEKIKLGI